MKHNSLCSSLRRRLPALAVLFGTLFLAFWLYGLRPEPRTLSYIAAPTATAPAKAPAKAPAAARRVRSKMITFPYEATGAGTVAADGIYTEAGIYNGQPYGTNGAGFYLFWNGDDNWHIHNALDSGVNEYYASPSTTADTMPPSGWSNYEGSFPAPALSEYPAPDAPLAPTFDNVDKTTLDVILPALPTGADTLNLERSPAGAETWTEVATGQAGAATVAQSGLSSGTSYDYRAIAVNGGGETPGPSAEVTTLMASPGTANLLLTFPASVGNIANAVPTGTDAAVASVVNGAGLTIPAKQPMLVQQWSHRRGDAFSDLAGATAIDKAKGASMTLSGLVEPVWFAEENELTYQSHVDGAEPRQEFALTIAETSSHRAALVALAEEQPSGEQAFEHRAVQLGGDRTFKIQHYSSIRGAIPYAANGNVRTREIPLSPVLPTTGSAVKFIISYPTPA